MEKAEQHMKRIGTVIILFSLLTGIMSFSFNVHLAKGSGTIHIKADGSIDPPTAPVSTLDNVTYTLTANINSPGDGIIVERENITIDGDQYAVQGLGTSNGINVTGRSNVTVKNTLISNFVRGIYLDDTNRTTVSGNVIANNDYGIKFSSSFNVSIRGNDITATSEYGIWLGSSSNVSISGNNITANNSYGIYLASSSNNSISGNNMTNNSGGVPSGGIVLIYSSNNNSIFGNNITNSSAGVWLNGCSKNSIGGNNITANNDYGIWLHSSSNNIVSGNNVTANNGDGIVLDYSSDNNTLSGNNIANNFDGIGLDNASGNTLSSNNVAANTNHGILLNSSSNNVLSGNNVTNSEYGIELSASFNNFIFHNSFADNTNQVFTAFSADIWDDGSRGNYWSDYLTTYPNAAQVGNSGVWNTPYAIDTNNTDHYPLMVPYVIPEFPSIRATMFFMLLTLLAVIIYKKKGVRTRQS